MTKRFSSADDVEMLRRFARGESCLTIAGEMGCRKGSVRHRMYKLLHWDAMRLRRPLTAEAKQLVEAIRGQYYVSHRGRVRLRGGYYWKPAEDAVLARVVLDPSRIYERYVVEQIYDLLGGRRTPMAIRRRIALLRNMPRREVEAMLETGGAPKTAKRAEEASK